MKNETRGGCVTASDAENEVEANAPVIKDEEIIDGLKKWLDRKDITFLEWLREDPAWRTMECPPSEETDRIKGELERYKVDIAKLRKRLAPDQPETDQGFSSIIELLERAVKVIDENAALKTEVERLEGLVENMKMDFQRSLEKVPDEKSALIMKEIELKELESRLKAKAAELEMTGPLRDAKAPKDIEREIFERYTREMQTKEEKWRQREQELRANVERLEKDLAKALVDLKVKEEQLKLGNLSSGNAVAEIDKKLMELQSKEKESLLMKVQLENLKAEMIVREEEVNRLREAINKKEEEMARREEEIQYKEKVIAAERLKLEEAKKEVLGISQVELKKKLEDLGNEIKAKEEELRNKEKWLAAKAEEIRQREAGIIEDDLKARQKELVVELQQAKAKTGNNRLDDLLYGGIPLGSNIMVHGPPFQGKETMVNVFMADGLKKGVPVLWVITDKTPKDIRDEMRYVISGYEEYEARGLVKYIDCYSRSMGDETQDPYTIYVEEPTDHDKISEMVEVVCKEFKERAKYYRMAFRSVSTLIAYSDPSAAFKFLSPLCGRRKRDQAVSMYLVEKGMHGEQEIQMLGSIMDGMFDFKVEQMKTYFSVQGIADVQSRAYIRYTATKHSLNIGSFALDHIR
ncbi:MAG: recombinase RecA [Methanomassiliicoccales archaeon]|nr:MAG: recombinase RecA [Methanomassiliicoccales archaeon]